jgi:hypothetical protein
MRIYDIKDWQNKRLRSARWPKDVHLCRHLDDNWHLHSEEFLEFGMNPFNEETKKAIVEIMNRHDIEEYHKLPTKTHDLKWDEAYIEWQNGWQVSCDSDDRWFVDFGEDNTWTTLDFTQRRYHLTGERR